MTPRLQALSSPTPTQSDGSEELPLADDSFDPADAPFIQAVTNADVPGVLFTVADLKRPEVAPYVANSRKIPSLGLGIYTNPTKKIAALFNPAVITLEELKKVDAAGKLDKVLTPYATFGASTPTSASKGSEPPPTQVTQPSVAQPPVQPASKGSQTAATKAVFRGAPDPSRQKVPGGGAMLNSLLRTG